MKSLELYTVKQLIFLLILMSSFRVSSQETNLKDYCIVGYYASKATSNFKTPFIFNFGENNTFEYLEVDGIIKEGKYTIANGNLKMEFKNGEDNFKIKGEKITSTNDRTFAMLTKKIFGNRLKNNRYTGVLYKQNSKVEMRTSYQFLGNDKLGISNEKGGVTSYHNYSLVGNLGGHNFFGLKRQMRSVFVLYGNQLVVINIYKNSNEGATYGILNQVN